MAISLRPFNPETDYEGRAALQNTVDAEVVTGDELRERARDAPQDRIVERTTAVDAQGKIVGMSSVGRENWMKPGHFWFWIVVDPALYGHGIGNLLYQKVERFLGEHEGSYVETTVRETHPEGLRFAQKRGFTIHKLTFESVLDLSRFDEAAFGGVIETVEAADIRFFTLADVGNTPEAHNMFTGVDRAYRGRHIALALKLLATRCARRYGATHIRTNNDSRNAPMLTVNRKLGYQPEPGIYTLLSTKAVSACSL